MVPLGEKIIIMWMKYLLTEYWDLCNWFTICVDITGHVTTFKTIIVVRCLVESSHLQQK